MSARYSEIVLDHFYHPRNGYRMKDADLVGRAGEPGRGPFMLVYLRVNGDRIAAASFQTYGCGAAIAAGSVLTEGVRGGTLAEAARWTERAVNEALGGLPAEKRHCSRLAADALADALGREREEKGG